MTHGYGPDPFAISALFKLDDFSRAYLGRFLDLVLVARKINALDDGRRIEFLIHLKDFRAGVFGHAAGNAAILDPDTDNSHQNFTQFVSAQMYKVLDSKLKCKEKK